MIERIKPVDLPFTPDEIAAILSAATLEERRELELKFAWLAFDDDEAFCRESLVVQKKEGVLAPAVWGYGQRRLFEAIQKQREKGDPVRLIYLKPRQAWISTGAAMKLFKETVFQPGQSCLVVAHDLGSATKIFDYYKRFQIYYKPFRSILQLPKLVTPKNLENPNQSKLAWANGSYIEIETANNLTGGRSFTARRIHLSEYAFYRDAATLMTGLMQSLPDDPESMLIIESTANGMGGAFYNAWNRAMEGKNDFTPVFLAWWEHEEYQRALDTSPERFQDSLTNDEREMIGQFNLSFERIMWRRWAIANKCEDDENRFRQEYPSTPEEAFLSSGRPRFRPVYVRRHRAVTPAIIGALLVQRIGPREETFVEVRERGELSVWDRPQKDHGYVIGADTAEGIDVNEGGDPDPDYSVADVFETQMGLQVAQLRERLTPAEFGRYIFELGRWYNWAYLVVEVNSIGQSTMDTLLSMGYPTDRIYRREIYDEAGRMRTKKLGFKTTLLTRDQWITSYEAALAGFGDGGLILRSSVSIQEAFSFKVKASGKAEAEQGCHDDTITSGGLAARGLPFARELFHAVLETTQQKDLGTWEPAYGMTASERAAAAFGEFPSPPSRDLTRFRSRM